MIKQYGAIDGWTASFFKNCLNLDRPRWSLTMEIPMAVKKLAKVTDHLLRDLLWDAMNKVYSGEMEHKQGAVVAKTAGQILNIEKVRIAMHKAGLLVNRKDLLEK